MKSILLLNLPLFALSAFAQFTPIADDFSTSGNLVGTTPDSGAGTWAQISNTSPALSVSSGSLGLAASSGESAQLNFASGNLSSGILYMGWDFTVSASGSIATNDSISAIAGFRSGTASSGVFELSFGVFRPSAAAQSFSGVPSTTTSQFAVGLFSGASLNASSTNLAEWSAALDRGTKYRAVLALDLTNDQATLWLNPTSIGSPSVSISSTAAARGIFFRQGAATHGAIAIDDVVVTQTFSTAAALPVPEASTFSLFLGLSALAGAATRRGRKTAPTSNS